MMPNLSGTVFGIVKVKFITDIAEEPWGNRPAKEKKGLKTCWKKVCLQPGRHSVEDEVDGLVEDAGGLVELQLGLEVVVLALHVHDHGVQELDLLTKILYNFFGNCL